MLLLLFVESRKQRRDETTQKVALHPPLASSGVVGWECVSVESFGGSSSLEGETDGDASSQGARPFRVSTKANLARASSASLA
jgi:hypothetical protein